MEMQVNGAKNCSRCNNLIFYNILDANPSESFADSEETVIRYCSTHLNFHIHPNLIERTHSLGRYLTDHIRPIIVKFSSFKTKEIILSDGKNSKALITPLVKTFLRRSVTLENILWPISGQKQINSPCTSRHYTYVPSITHSTNHRKL